MFGFPIVDSPLIDHHGASALAPANTIAAVELAAKLGARWIETDVRLTADHGLVMIHDPTLDRTSNGQASVVQTTMEEIRSLDGGGWFSPGYAGEPIPDLQTETWRGFTLRGQDFLWLSRTIAPAEKPTLVVSHVPVSNHSQVGNYNTTPPSE